MFEFLRKHSKVVMWVVLIFVGAPFVFFYGVSSQVGKSRKIELTVYGHKISSAELMAEQRMIDMFSQSRNQDPNFLVNQAKQNLTLYYKAVGAGVKASDAMVRNYIAKFPPFLDNGRFEKEFYKDFLGRYRMTSASFEEGIRRILTMQKFVDILRGAVRISDDEIVKNFTRQNQTADFKSVTLNSDDFKKQVQITEDDIVSYYASNKKSFEKEAEIKIEYLLAWANDYEQTVKVSEAEIKTQYENTKKRYKDKSFGDVHDEIKSLLTKMKSENLAKEAMDNLRAKMVLKNANWQDLAKKNNIIYKISPFFGASKIVSQDFGWAQIDFNAKENQISPIIRTLNFKSGMKIGQMIYRVLAKKSAVIPKLADIKEKVKEKLIIEKSKELAAFEMQKIQKLLVKQDFDKVAKQNKLDVDNHKNVTFNSLGVDGDKLYALPIGGVSEVLSQPDRIVVGMPAKYNVFKLIKRNPIDEAELNKKKDEIKRSLTNAKNSLFWQSISQEIDEENKKLP